MSLRRLRLGGVAAALAALAGLAACGPQDTVTSDGRPVLRVGHFPNVTHAQALIGHALSEKGKGWFEERLPPGTQVEWYVFNAGPGAMEGIFAGSLDLVYVGPSPAVNAYLRSRGQEVRVLSGACRGGSALVARAGSEIEEPEDFRGKRIATPQLGNTQDVACRAWLGRHGIRVTQTGGDADVMPTENPVMFALFLRREIDAAWTVEPWVSRLEREAAGRIVVEEPDAVTTVLAGSVRLLRERRDLAKSFVAAHEELTRWIASHSEEAQQIVRQELASLTHQPMPADLLAHCWPRLRFETPIGADAFESFVETARSVGFLAEGGDVAKLVETP
jgi:NitT/TauT family transport system substrate-binding protein